MFSKHMNKSNSLYVCTSALILWTVKAGKRGQNFNAHNVSWQAGKLMSSSDIEITWMASKQASGHIEKMFEFVFSQFYKIFLRYSHRVM